MTEKPDFTVTNAKVDRVFRHNSGEGFVIAWETESAGFGELTIAETTDGLRVDTEAMGFDFCMQVFRALLKRGREESPVRTKST